MIGLPGRDVALVEPRIDLDLLSQHSAGLIGMSACLRGHIPETILNEKYDDARRMAHQYGDVFGKNNFFLEVQDHHLEQDKRLTPALVRLSSETGYPLVATNDSHYLRKDDARAHEILMCIQTGKSFNDPNRMRWSTPDFYLKTREEMMELFGELEHSLDRTWEIAERCHVKVASAPPGSVYVNECVPTDTANVRGSSFWLCTSRAVEPSGLASALAAARGESARQPGRLESAQANRRPA